MVSYPSIFTAFRELIEGINCAPFRNSQDQRFRWRKAEREDEIDEHWAHLDYRVNLGESKYHGRDRQVLPGEVLFDIECRGEDEIEAECNARIAGDTVAKILAESDLCISCSGVRVESVTGTPWYHVTLPFTLTTER